MSYLLRIVVVFTLLAGLLSACSSELPRQEYIQRVERYENGLHIKKEAGTYTVDVQYKPAPYVLLQEETPNPGDTAGFGAKLAEYEAIQYYTLTIGLQDSKEDFLRHGVSTVVEQQQKLYYYSYLFQNDLYVEENGQKLPCVLFHFERSYDLKPSRTFVLGFEQAASGQSETAELVIHSRWLQAEPIRVRIEKQNIPSIKL